MELVKATPELRAGLFAKQSSWIASAVPNALADRKSRSSLRSSTRISFTGTVLAPRASRLGFAPGTTLTADQVAALQKVSITVSGGWQEPIFANGYTVNGTTYHTGISNEVQTLVDAGLPIDTDFVNGGQEWYTWRLLLRDFLVHGAFQPTVHPTV